MNYVAGNKTFECVVANDEAREKLLQRKHPDLEGPNVIEMRTWEEAENDLAEFYQDYVRETHPAKERHGEPLYDFIIANLMLPGLSRPASILSLIHI